MRLVHGKVMDMHALEKIAFFDVDHTLTKGATPLPFALACARRKMIKKRYFFLVPFLYVAYRFFSIRMESLFQMILPYLRGVTRDVFLSVGEEAFKTKIQKDFFNDAKQELKMLQEKGVRVVLATSSPFEAVVFLARYCGIPDENIISTRFHYEGDVFDGRLEGVPVFSRYKRDIVLRFARMAGVAISDCSFYSDSIHDLPLLEAVGRPVATNPDKRLLWKAKQKGWEIKYFK